MKSHLKIVVPAGHSLLGDFMVLQKDGSRKAGWLFFSGPHPTYGDAVQSAKAVSMNHVLITQVNGEFKRTTILTPVVEDADNAE